MKYIYVFLIFFVPWLSFAQKHDNNWIVGRFTSRILSFETSPPKVLPDNLPLGFSVTGIVGSDTMGNLMFYSNGKIIYNHQHEMMENGDSLMPGFWWSNDLAWGRASTLTSFVLPYPGHSNHYMLVHLDLTFEPDSAYKRFSPLYYTHIDMNANDGKGKVLVKNQVLQDADLTMLAACKHANGRDWWITFGIVNTTKQITYLLSPNGFEGPFCQNIGPAFGEREVASQCTFSPDGRYYVRHDSENGIRVMDFDRCSGQFSNLRIVPYPVGLWSWGAAFSPSSRFLYLSKPSVIWSVDMLATNLASTFDTLAIIDWNTDPLGNVFRFSTLLQLGPDGKIYGPSFAPGISTIEQPNLPKFAADVNFGGFPLDFINDAVTCHFPNYRLGALEGSGCDTLGLRAPPDVVQRINNNAGEQGQSPEKPKPIEKSDIIINTTEKHEKE